MRFAVIKTAALAAVLTLALVSPAEAQRTGTRMGKNAGAPDIPAAMRIMAECTVARRGTMVRSWLDTLPGSVEEDRIFTRNLDDLGLCFDDDMLVVDGKTIVVKVGMVRYPLALAMARRQLRVNSTVPALAKDSPWFAPKLVGLDKSAAVDRLALGMQDFGHCVAVSDWAAARALVLSEEGSTEQKAAVAALFPVLGPCLPSDVQIKLTPANLRSAVAEPMVHMLASSSSSTTASK
jgi:hypothetical protein